MALVQEPMDGYDPGYNRGAIVNGGQFSPGFVDEDGKGVCDNLVDEDGDGFRDLAGTWQGRGAGVVDVDGDGVCDNFVDSDADGLYDHAGQGDYGPGFVDEDGDGVYDYTTTGRQAGGEGRMMGHWMQ